MNITNLKKVGLYLNPSESIERFNLEFETMKHSFKKLETLQYYEEGDDFASKDLIEKNYNKFAKKIKQFKESEKQYYLNPLQLNVDLKRIHLISFPISQYIETEYYFYYVSNALGENIVFNDIEKFDKEKLSDFIIFDLKYLIINDFDEKGNFIGAWHVDEIHATAIENLANWYDKTFEKCQDFKMITKPNAKILEMIL